MHNFISSLSQDQTAPPHGLAPSLMAEPADERFEHIPHERSLKRRIQALGVLVGVTLVSAAFLGLQIFEMTESARMTDAVTQLNLGLERMIRQFENTERTPSPSDIGSRSLLENAQALRAISQESMADLAGLEGGFYAHAKDRLLGYAYPTYLGSGPKTDIPEAERPAITRMAGQAIVTNTQVHEQVERGFDVILFGASPLIHNGQAVGAVWAMYRLPGIRNPQWRYYSFSLIAMLAMAALVAGSAWWIARRLDRAIAQIVAGIRTLHGTALLPISATRYTELNRVIHAINNLVTTVHIQHTRREQLERQLHQADRLAILGRLVAGVAHEVRNPLSSIRLKLQLARRGAIDPGKLLGTFDVVEKEISRLDRLVARLLSVAKPTASSCVPTDIDQFVQTRLLNWSTRAAEFNIIVSYTGTGESGFSIWVDQDRLGQILDNLIANAFDALTGTGGTIQISFLRNDDRMFCLAVNDSGPGISLDAEPHLFEPFFTTKPQGTGLGLFLSAEIARASGGTLAHVDGPERGACFELRFPYRAVENDSNASKTLTAMHKED